MFEAFKKMLQRVHGPCSRRSESVALHALYEKSTKVREGVLSASSRKLI